MLSLSSGRRVSAKICDAVAKRSSSKALKSQRYSSIPSPFSQLLKPNHSQIILAEQNLLSSLLSCLRMIDASKNDIDLVYDTRSRMDDLFLIVVVGEFNSGKSTFINSLIGMNLLKSGVLPTTNKICIVRHESDHGSQGTSWKQADNMLLGDVQEIKIDLHWLKNIAIVDTPGTNAIVSEHEQLTQQIIPRADMIIFVTSAERPMSDSESAVLNKIKQWGKKVVMLVNKMDILENSSEKEQVLDFVTQHAAKLLGDTIKLLPIFGVSSRLALNGKLLSSNGNKSSFIGSSSWEESKFETFEKYLTSVLGQDQLIQCKLNNPLGVADRIITTSINETEKRKNILEGDFRILEMIEENFGAHKKDMDSELNLLRSNIKNLLMQMSQRCDKFLDENMTMMKPTFLLDMKLFEEEFTKQVLMDINLPIDDIVVSMCDLICRKTKIQARSVVDFVGNRPNKHRDNIIGSVNFVTPDDKQFEATKYELIERIRRNIKTVLSAHDQSRNIVKMSSDVRSSALQVAAVQGLSVASIGALTASNMLGLAAGVVSAPGLVLLGASSSMALGMFLVPRKKEILKKKFSEQITSLISQIDTVIINDTLQEMQNNDICIRNSIVPYSRYIDSEKKKVYASLEALDILRKETRDIQNKLR